MLGGFRMSNLYEAINEIEPITEEQYKWVLDVISSGRP